MTAMCSVCVAHEATRNKRLGNGYLMALCKSCEPKLCRCQRGTCKADQPPTVCRFVIDPHERMGLTSTGAKR